MYLSSTLSIGEQSIEAYIWLYGLPCISSEFTVLLHMHRKSWPSSLRHCAAGHLQNLAEFWPNLEYIGGNISLLASMVLLCKSKVPLLELRGAWGIARTTFHVPEGCPTPQATIDECKACVAQQGGIAALTPLLQRLNHRYILISAKGWLYVLRWALV